jgi:hypothetical protein
MGIAKEAPGAWGVPVAATNFLPISPPTPKDVVKLSQDKGLRGSMVAEYGEIQTVKHSTFDFAGDLFADTFGFLLAGVLGDLTTTGSAAPYSHAFSVLNSADGQPPSYTLTDAYSVNTRQYPGAKFSDLDIKFSAEGLLTYAAKAVALPSVAIAVPTPSFTGVAPIPAYIGTIAIGGTPSLSVLDGNIQIKRAVSVVDTVDGTQAPHALWSGPVSVSGKLTLVMEDEVQLTNYLSNTQPSLDVTFQVGTGAALQQVKLHMSQVAYQSADITRGKDFVELPLSFTAVANTTDIGASGGFSPIKCTLQNAIVAGTYK